jgi:hypothetical protein
MDGTRLTGTKETIISSLDHTGHHDGHHHHHHHGTHITPAVVERARVLGIPESESLWMWIAAASMTSDMPEGWEEFNDDQDNTAYYHPKTKRLQKTHPMLDKFSVLYQKCRAFNDRAGKLESEQRMDSMVTVVMNEVLNRCNRELPPVTPEIVERLSILFAINTAEDFKMANKLKIWVADFAEQQYDLLVATSTKLTVHQFIEHVRNDMVRVEVFEKPEKTVMCCEFPEKPAVVKDLVTFEFYSLEGFAKTHAQGKRKNHETAKVEQTVCRIYPDKLATCEVDNSYFSDDGYRAALMKNPGLRSKHLKIIGGYRCLEYPEKRAEVLTEDTLEFLSWEGYFKLHRRRGLTGRLYQFILTIDEDGYFYRMGQKLPPEERSRLVDKARFLAEGGPWCSFQDDQLDAYWYNFHDKVVVHTNPYFGYTGDAQ